MTELPIYQEVFFTALGLGFFFLPAMIAKSKGFSFVGFFLFSFFLWLPALIAVLWMPANTTKMHRGRRLQRSRPQPGTRRAAPQLSRVFEGSVIETRTAITLPSGAVLPAGFVSQVEAITSTDTGILARVATPEGPVWVQRDQTQLATVHPQRV